MQQDRIDLIEILLTDNRLGTDYRKLALELLEGLKRCKAALDIAKDVSGV